MVNMPKELTPAKFIINNKELFIDGCINFAINGIFINDISKMVRDDRKIKIYSKHRLLGVFYLQRYIHVEFFIGYYKIPFKLFSINAIYINSIIAKFNNRNSENYYEVHFLYEGSESQRIVIRSNNYDKNMKRIIFYAKMFYSLELVFDKEKIDIPIFCINGMYIFNIIKLEANANHIELTYDNKHKISINLGTNIVRLTIRHSIIFLSFIEKKVSECKISNKDNLVLGYSIYK